MVTTTGSKKIFEFDRLTTPIRVQSRNFCFEIIFDKGFKFGKNMKHVIFEFNGVEPNVFGVMVDKDNIICRTIN